ncbi:hypothetical protein H8E07_10770, partial [bacterium]|nr:hypothetical protein [bacterium]
MSVLEWILLKFCRGSSADSDDHLAADWRQAMARLVVDYPDLRRLIAGMRVVDFGCGERHLDVATPRQGAHRALGVDLDTELLQPGHRLAREPHPAPRAR